MTMRLTAQLRHLSYLVRKRPYRLEKPHVLQFPIIDICNSQCQMCKIWENKKSQDISIEQLRIGLRNALFSEVSAVGLNGGEPTLRKDLRELTTVLFEELPKLSTISLITNAYRYDEVIERVTEVGQAVKRHRGHFDLMVSLDGVGDLHDRVRGKPGNFSRALKVLDFAQKTDLVDNLRIGCTVIRENVYGVHELLEFAIRRGIYIKYRLGIPHQRLYTSDLVTPYALSDEEKYHLCEFLLGLNQHYETNRVQRFFYSSLADQLVHGAPRKAGCDWQHRGATISSRGELLYCAVQSMSLGAIHLDDSHKTYFSNEWHLDEIKRTKCDKCHHDYMGLPPKAVQLMDLLDRALSITRTRFIANAIQNSPTIGQIVGDRRLAKRHRQLSFARTTTHEQHATEPHVKRILICGWYGTETLGDKAILGGILIALRRSLGNTKCTLASLNPYVSLETKRQLPELADVDVVSVHAALDIAEHADAVIFGGGPVMAVTQIADMLAIFERAKKSSRPTIIAGCGIGPLGNRNFNRAIRNLLQASTVRIYRDELSKATAKQLGVDTTNDCIAEDPAFTWLNEMRQQLQEPPASDHKTLLLGLRKFPWREYARGLSYREAMRISANFEKVVLETLHAVIQNHPGTVLKPIPMCTNHFGSDDRWFFRRLFRGNSDLTPHIDDSLLGRELSPRHYCAEFLAADALIGMRYHSLIFALALGTPALAIDYTLGEGKVASLAKQYSMSIAAIDSIDRSTLVAEVDRLLTTGRSQPIEHESQFSTAFSDRLSTLL